MNSNGRGKGPSEGRLNAGVPRLLEVLEGISSQPNGVTVTELARMLGITKAAASRILAAYVESGLAHKDAAQRHVPGLRLWALGVKALQFFRIADLARPILQEAANNSNITLYLATVRGSDVYYIEQLGPGWSSPMPIPAVHPIHATGPGKAIMAYLHEDRIEEILSQPLERFTPQTITDREQFLRELAEIRERGYAINRGELEEHAVGITVALLDGSGEPVAAIGNAPPYVDFNDEYIETVSPILVEVGHRISTALGRVGAKLMIC